jgi:hypothetical protein
MSKIQFYYSRYRSSEHEDCETLDAALEAAATAIDLGEAWPKKITVDGETVMQKLPPLGETEDWEFFGPEADELRAKWKRVAERVGL